MESSGAFSQDVIGNQQVELLGPRLKSGERGVVLTEIQASWFGQGNELNISTGNGIDGTHLRTMLLFFDRIDIPSNNIMGTPIGDAEQLVSSGIAHRSRVMGSGEMAAQLSAVPFSAFKANEKREPGRWALGQSSQSMGIPESELTPGQAFCLDLQNALPVFDRDVELGDVLEFREKRHSELLALRSSMDDFLREVASAGFDAAVASASLEKFDAALADHLATMRESNLKKVALDLKASMDWPQLASGAAPALASVLHGLPLASAAWTFATGSGASIALSTIKGLRAKRSGAAFRYLTSAERKLF